jgi:hypothetical protein
MEQRSIWPKGWRGLALILVGIVMGATLITPAVAHIGSWTHNWTVHIKPKVRTYGDGRWVRRTLGPGQTISGPFGTSSGDTGYAFTAIEFNPHLAADVPVANAHYMVGTTDANCPGNNQAAPGHLCVYQTHGDQLTFACFCDPESAGVGIRATGTVLYWTVNAGFNHVRGNWAYRAPAASSSSTQSSPSSSSEVLP